MTDWVQVGVARAAWSVVSTSLQVKPGEQVAVVADSGSDFAVVDALLAAVVAAGGEPSLLVMPQRAMAGAPANAVIAGGLSGANVIIAPTSTGIAFTPAFGAALKAGARGIVMTAVRAASLTGGAALADYEEVYRATKPLVDALEAGKQIRVTCAHGSDFTASLDGAKYNIGASFAREPGQVSGFPSGEAWGVPVTGTAEGVLVADGTAHMLGRLREPVRTTWEKGRCVKIEGGEQAEELKRITAGIENSDNLGELSIGTNAWAADTGITEHKKLLGTMHFALGNSVVGGNVKSAVHIDLMLLHPTAEVDGKVIVENGKPLV